MKSVAVREELSLSRSNRAALVFTATLLFSPFRSSDSIKHPLVENIAFSERIPDGKNVDKQAKSDAARVLELIDGRRTIGQISADAHLPIQRVVAILCDLQRNFSVDSGLPNCSSINQRQHAR